MAVYYISFTKYFVNNCFDCKIDDTATRNKKRLLKSIIKIIIWMLIVVGLAFLMLIIDWVFSKG